MRCSGKTFRCLLTAVYSASLDNRVIYVAYDLHHAKALVRKAFELCNVYLAPGFTVMDLGERRIDMIGAGSIQFMSPGQMRIRQNQGKFRGPENLKFVKDF